MVRLLIHKGFTDYRVIQKAKNLNTCKRKGKIIELLPSTQSIIAGDRLILNNVEPAIADPIELTQHCRLIAVFTELFEDIGPSKDLGDEAHLRLSRSFGS